MRHAPLHALAVTEIDELPHRPPARYLAVGVTMLYGHPMNDAHRHAVEWLRGRRPVARTGTFLIFLAFSVVMLIVGLVFAWRTARLMRNKVYLEAEEPPLSDLR